MVKWEEEINNLPNTAPSQETVTYADILRQYDDFITLLSGVPDTGDLISRLTAQRYAACQEFYACVQAMLAGAANEGDEEPEFLAGMNVVTWYLHESWKTLRDPLPVHYARVLGLIFFIGYRIGRYRGEHHERDDNEQDRGPDPGREPADGS